MEAKKTSRSRLQTTFLYLARYSCGAGFLQAIAGPPTTNNHDRPQHYPPPETSFHPGHGQLSFARVYLRAKQQAPLPPHARVFCSLVPWSPPPTVPRSAIWRLCARRDSGARSRSPGIFAHSMIPETHRVTRRKTRSFRFFSHLVIDIMPGGAMTWLRPGPPALLCHDAVYGGHTTGFARPDKQHGPPFVRSPRHLPVPAVSTPASLEMAASPPSGATGQPLSGSRIGRPPQWTVSRSRKLARLYLFSTLPIERSSKCSNMTTSTRGAALHIAIHSGTGQGIQATD